MSFIRRIYEISPVPVQNFVVGTYGYYLHHLRYGGEFKRHLDEIEQSQWLSREGLVNIQTSSLTRLLNHAKDQCPFYRATFEEAGIKNGSVCSPDDLCRLPLLDRATIREAAEGMVTGGTKRRRLIPHYTCGTTGTPLKLYLDSNTYRRNYAFWTRFRRWFGWDMWKRRATFGGRIVVPAAQHAPPYWRYNRVENQLIFSSFHMSERTILSYVHALSEFKPVVVEGYVSSIYLLCHLARAAGIELPRPKAVQTTSETLLPHHRRLIEETMGCRVYNQYGHGEAAVFVSECEQGTLHVSDEYGLMEIIGEKGPVAPGQRGEVVVTGFNNWAMPLIRYRTGDLAVRSEPGRTCPCGRGLSVVTSIEGRVLDMIHLPSGRAVPPTALTLLFDRAHALGIAEARVRQVDIDRIIVELVRGNRREAMQIETIERELRLIVGDEVHVTFKDVEAIPRARSGKFQFVVSEVASSAHKEAVVGNCGEPIPRRASQ